MSEKAKYIEWIKGRKLLQKEIGIQQNCDASFTAVFRALDIVCPK